MGNNTLWVFDLSNKEVKGIYDKVRNMKIGNRIVTNASFRIERCLPLGVQAHRVWVNPFYSRNFDDFWFLVEKYEWFDKVMSLIREVV